ncbi:MAG TPA: FHA domain-containing protein [Myxococcota bacterium]
MTNGRRAADRRRERGGGGGDFNDDELGTTPGAAPASPHNDYVEVDDEPSQPRARLTSREENLPSELEPSEVREPSVSQRRQQPPRPAQTPRGQIIDEDLPDAEKSFARELKRRPVPTDTRVNVKVERTEIKEPKQRRERRGGVLRVLTLDGAPVAAPTTLPIALYPSLLGRSVDAELRLEDPTVSLRHVELNWDDDGFSLVDLGSRSGTLINGVVVGGRTALAHGDIIAVGKSELRFIRADVVPTPRPEPEPEPEPVVEPQQALAPLPPERTATNIRIAREQKLELERRAAARKKTAARKKAALVVAAVLGLGAAVVVVGYTARTAFSDSAPAQIRHQIAVLLGEAKKFLQEGDVDAAHARVVTILGLQADNAEAISLDRTVTTEKSSRDALQLALRMGDEDRDDEALAALARIADSSVFAKDRDRLKAALASRALVRSLRAVENLLDQGRVDDALARAEAHVKRFPDDAGGLALLARVQAAKAGSPRDPALGPARAAFAEGRLDDARSIAKSNGYLGYAGDIDRFERVLGEGTTALARFDAAAARGPLDEAFRLLGSLGASATSPIFRAVQKPYADALYLSGTEKLAAGDGCGAARDLFKAARVLPGDNRIEGELQKLQSIADQGLQKARGAHAQDAARAASIAREALCTARSGTETFEALQQLAR